MTGLELLKIVDSKTDGTPRLTSNASFDDPSWAPDGGPRRGIEVPTQNEGLIVRARRSRSWKRWRHLRAAPR
jgi:hypothetical protein